MTITGAGTETDPYLVSTAEELRACLESNDSGDYPNEYIQLANNIDKVGDKLTGTYITGVKTLLGNGEGKNKIRNIWLSNAFLFIKSANDSFTIKGIHFENLDIGGTGATCSIIDGWDASTTNFIDCSLHIHVFSVASGVHIFNCNAWSHVVLERTEILLFTDKSTVKGNNAIFDPSLYVLVGLYANNYGSIKQSRIVYDFTVYPTDNEISFSLIPSGTSYNQIFVCADSYFIIKNNTDYSNQHCTINVLGAGDGYLQLDHCYITTIGNNIRKVNTQRDYPTTGTEHINNLLLDAGELSNDTFTKEWDMGSYAIPGVKQLTTAQLKDPDYLNSIYWYVNKEGE